MKIKELIKQLVNCDDMDAEVYITDASNENNFDPYNSIEWRVEDVLPIWRRGAYLTINLNDTKEICTDECPFKIFKEE